MAGGGERFGVARVGRAMGCSHIADCSGGNLDVKCLTCYI